MSKGAKVFKEVFCSVHHDIKHHHANDVCNFGSSVSNRTLVLGKCMPDTENPISIHYLVLYIVMLLCVLTRRYHRFVTIPPTGAHKTAIFQTVVSHQDQNITLFNSLIKLRAEKYQNSALLWRVVSESIKALCHWPLWGESTGDRWIPFTKGQ